jgi:cation:H+ antiporter
MVGAVSVTSRIIRREVRLAVVAVALFGLLAWIGLALVTGIVLALAMVGALVLLVRWARGGGNSEVADDAMEFTAAHANVDVPVDPGRLPAWGEPVRALLGLAGVLIGAQLLVVNASSIAERLGVSQVVIGFTLVALGTSTPELVTTIAAQRRRESDLVVGNLFGSNLFNSLAGGALVGIASGNAPDRTTSLALLVAMVLTSVVAWSLLRRGLRLTRAEGAVLLLIYAGMLPIVIVG